MEQVIFYTKEVCSLCEEAQALLEMFQNDYLFDIIERDIHSKDEWLEEYQLLIPFIQINEATLNCEELNIVSLEEVLKENTKKR